MVLTKEELIECLQKEARILTHLCGKVRPEMLDYRPTEKQRSMLELLRYLTVMGRVLVRSVKAGRFLVEEWNAAEAKAAGMEFRAVAEDLEALAAEYAAMVGAFTEEELRGEVELFGSRQRRGPMLVDIVVCGHAAYRAQLFCYLKACGREELNTMNLWAGVDGAM